MGEELKAQGRRDAAEGMPHLEGKDTELLEELMGRLSSEGIKY